MREGLSPRFWALGPDARAKIAESLQTISNPMMGSIRHHWMIVEQGGAVLGVMHGINLPTPPIYEARGGEYAGVMLDDSHVPSDPQVADALLRATERLLRDAGAGVFVAASPIGWKTRTDFFRGADYTPTTSYMFKPALSGVQPALSSVRTATEADLDGIVRLSARHRAGLEIANPDFWRIHPEADTRFAAWMRMSLEFKDRSMFVAGDRGKVDGFVIAQPASPLHLSAAHDSSKLGLIDDFCALAFDAPDEADGRTGEPAALLSAAEAAFEMRGLDAALAISPTRMTAKIKLLEEAGYRETNLWMTRRGDRTA